MKIRLDQLIVQLGQAPSRTKAQELLERGAVCVYVDGVERSHPKASDKLDPEKARIEISDGELLKYVSRAGLKLEGALKVLGISVKGLVCLDVGQSTGGFTHCLLEHGAQEVDGFDVGEGQLAEKIKQDPRVRYFEKLNVKDLANVSDIPLSAYDFIVMDISFISITKALPHLRPYLKPGGQLLILVKPQYENFELSLIKERVSQYLGELHLKLIEFIPSSEKGRDGTQEYFALVSM